jgi:hypothetical protein
MSKPPLIQTLSIALVQPDPKQPDSQGLSQPITVRKIGGSKAC